MTRRLARWTAAAAAVFAADWAFTAFTWVTWNRRPALAQDSFLLGALAARERGQLTLGNDHPLYPLLLSLWASRRPAAFTCSKLFSLGWGALTLGAVWGLGSALFGPGPAFAAALLLSVNWVFLSLSSSLRAEVLLPLFFFAAWAGAWRGFRGDGRWFLVSGLAAGLATLTKGTGTLLALCWGAAFVLAAARDSKLRRRAGWYLAGYLPAAGFLWWANWSVLGDPFYNYSTRHAFWLDSWWEAGTRPLAEQSAAGFLARHGLLGVPLRLLTGMRAFVPAWLGTLRPGESFPLFRILSWPLALAAAWSLWRARRRAWEALRRLDGAALYTAALLAAFFVLFSWYNQVSPSERFVAPLSPMLYLLAAAAAAPELERALAWVDARWPGRRPGLWLGGFLAGLTALGLGIKVSIWGVVDPFAADRPEPCYEEAMAWVAGRSGPVLYGPSADLSVWPLPHPEAAVAVPDGPPPADLAAWLESRGVRSAVVDWDMARQPFLEGHFDTMPGGGVLVTAMPEGWRQAGSDRVHTPPHMVLLEKAPPPTSYNHLK